MFAFFNLGLTELVVLGLFGLALLGGAVVLGAVLLLMRREQPIEPEDNAPAPRPPERRPPAPGGGEGITS